MGFLVMQYYGSFFFFHVLLFFYLTFVLIDLMLCHEHSWLKSVYIALDRRLINAVK